MVSSSGPEFDRELENAPDTVEEAEAIADRGRELAEEGRSLDLSRPSDAERLVEVSEEYSRLGLQNASLASGASPKSISVDSDLIADNVVSLPSSSILDTFDKEIEAVEVSVQVETISSYDKILYGIEAAGLKGDDVIYSGKGIEELQEKLVLVGRLSADSFEKGLYDEATKKAIASYGTSQSEVAGHVAALLLERELAEFSDTRNAVVAFKDPWSLDVDSKIWEDKRDIHVAINSLIDNPEDWLPPNGNFRGPETLAQINAIRAEYGEGQIDAIGPEFTAWLRDKLADRHPDRFPNQAIEDEVFVRADSIEFGALEPEITIDHELQAKREVEGYVITLAGLEAKMQSAPRSGSRDLPEWNATKQNKLRPQTFELLDKLAADPSKLNQVREALAVEGDQDRLDKIVDRLFRGGDKFQRYAALGLARGDKLAPESVKVLEFESGYTSTDEAGKMLDLIESQIDPQGFAGSYAEHVRTHLGFWGRSKGEDLYTRVMNEMDNEDLRERALNIFKNKYDFLIPANDLEAYPAVETAVEITELLSGRVSDSDVEKIHSKLEDSIPYMSEFDADFRRLNNGKSLPVVVGEKFESNFDKSIAEGLWGMGMGIEHSADVVQSARYLKGQS